MKKWMIIAAIVAVIGIIGGAGYLGYQNASNPPTATTNSQPPATVPVTLGDVQKTVIAPGKVVNTGTAVIAPTINSQISEIWVRPGDSVQAGDVLARLNDTTAQRAVTEAELAIAQAALRLDDDTINRAIATAQIAVEQAELNLATAQSKLDEYLNWEPDADEIALAEANLAAAEGRYSAALATDAATGYGVTNAQVRLEQAQRALAQAQDEYDNAHDPARDWEYGIDDVRKAHAANLQAAQDGLTVAQADYNAAQTRVNYGNSTAAQSDILSAEQALAKAQSGPTEAEITNAHTEVSQRELDLQRAQLDWATAQNNAEAGLSLEQAQLNLEKAQADLAATIITAPMDGSILSVSGNVGDMASPGMALFRIANQSAHEIQVSVIEEDLPLVQVGQTAVIYFDAQPDAELEGTVTRIVPQRIQGSDRPLYTVYITLPELPEGVVADMTVDTAIILDGRSDVLRLPRSLVSARGSGTGTVNVWHNSAIEERTIEVGLRGDTYIEILSGIAVGEEVAGQ